MLEKSNNLRKYIPKYALHGFWGSPIELLKLYMRKENEYIVEHMNKVRETIKQGKQARKVEERKRKIRINWTEEVGLCGLKKGEAVKEKDLCRGTCSKCVYAREF